MRRLHGSDLPARSCLCKKDGTLSRGHTAQVKLRKPHYVYNRSRRRENTVFRNRSNVVSSDNLFLSQALFYCLLVNKREIILQIQVDQTMAI
jgi:hypothetical protein